MKILIIEDEAALRDSLKSYLRQAGFVCEEAATFREGYKKLLHYSYECVLIDLNLPDGDGLKLVDLARDSEEPTGVIITSVRDGIEDRIQGLDLGADDYLTKPFNLSELNARIRAVLRRKAAIPDQTVRLGEIHIWPDERRVVAAGQELVLTRKEYDILWYLARNKNRVVTKDSIAEHLWGDYMDEAISFDFIYAHMKNLRKKLSEAGCGDYIKTIYGIGYKFLIP